MSVADAQESGRGPLLPAWVPVLHRGDDEVQVGLEPGPGVVLCGVPAGLARVLELLDGRHSVATLRRQADSHGVPAQLLDVVLARLRSAGLVVDGDAVQGPPAVGLRGRRLRVVGAGVLGSAVATAAVAAGVARLDLVDPDPVDPAAHPYAGLATTQAQALRAQLAGPDRRLDLRVANHWTKPDDGCPDLTVVATDRAEPDRVVGEDYVRADHPHLYVRPLTAGVVVGPLVVPGRTPCLGCSDLVRRDADPAWPRLLPQLCRVRIPVAAPLAAWAGVTAVLRVAAELGDTAAGGQPGTLELGATDLRVRYRSWPMHPGCGCAWCG